MYSKIIAMTAVCFGMITAACAQTDSLAVRKGRVLDTKGEAVPGVMVSVSRTDEKIIADEMGYFTLPDDVVAGDTLTFSSMGFKPARRIVPIANGSDAVLIIRMKDGMTALQEVEVVGRYEKSYKNTLSFIGTKTATPLKEVPQSIGYVTKELVLDQGAHTVNDVVKNISGVSQYTFYNDFSIRGFRTTGNRNSGNLINGMRAQTSLWKQSSLANIERVEIIKGPASVLFGNAAPGGVINRVTKKPLSEERHTVSVTAGSFNTIDAYTDFTGPLNRKRTLLYRLNLGYENSDTYRDLQQTKSYIVAPSFSFLPTDKTQFNVDLSWQYNDGKVDRGQAIFGDGSLYSRPISSSLSASNDYLHENLMNVTLSLTHKFNQHLTFNSIYLSSSYDEDLQEHNQANAYVTLADGTTDPTKVLMQCLIRKRHFRNNSFNNYLTWTTRTWGIGHKLLVGYDYFQTNLKPGSSQMLASGYLKKDGTTSTKYTVKTKDEFVLDDDGNPVTNVPAFDLTTNSGNAILDISKYVFVSSNISPYEQYSHGIYVQEQMDAGFLKLLLGLRQEWFTDVLNKGMAGESTTHQHAFLPRVGLVGTVNSHINLYATWMKGFEPQDAATQSDPNTGGPFAPETSTLYEAGAKTEWLDGRLSATLAVYRLAKTNVLYNAGDEGNPDLMVQVGEEVARGVEMDVAGDILPNWHVQASYAYTNAKITKTATDTEKDFGMQRPNTPRHSMNIWSKYIIRHGSLRNLGLGLGFNAVSSRYGQVGRRANTVTYPGYGLFNVALYYRLRHLQVQANLNNVFNRTYWVGGYDKLRSFPGAPRNINLTVTYGF